MDQHPFTFSVYAFCSIIVLIPPTNRASKSGVPVMQMFSAVAFIATTILAYIALSPSPDAGGLVALLVALHTYQRFSPRKAVHYIAPWAASTIGATISHISAANNALQGPSVFSLVPLMGISAAASLASVGVFFLDALAIGKKRRYSWSQFVAFAIIWTFMWGIISMLTSVGRLFTWSPVTGLGPYTWVSSYLGPWGIDFIVAAWSVILAEVVAIPLSQRAFLVEDPEDPTPAERMTPYTDNPDEPTPRDHSTLYHKSVVTLFLLALALPGFRAPTPLPTYTTTTTPFSLGCVLPQTHLPHKTPHSPTLEDYITETKKMTGAKLVLWPEGALKFNTEAERNETFKKIANETMLGHQGFHVGFGFEENTPESWNKRASRRNGFALLSGNDTVLQYYKRNLVPIAESFSMVPSDEEPMIYELLLGPPKGTSKSNWAEGPDYTRRVPITSSICLDFASQSSFLSLQSRPALILAPARTWHPSIGRAMWNQARQRAHETGSTILWCDGGEGGLSGVIGGGFEEPFQFGEGSWVKTIGLPYPFSERRTVFMWVGNLGGFLAVFMLAGAGFAIQATAIIFPTRASLLAWNMVKMKRVVHGFTGLLHQTQPNDAEQGEDRRLIEEDGRRDATLLDLDDDEQEHRQQQSSTYGAIYIPSQ